jgi:hypothetical protein
VSEQQPSESDNMEIAFRKSMKRLGNMLDRPAVLIFEEKVPGKDASHMRIVPVGCMGSVAWAMVDWAAKYGRCVDCPDVSEDEDAGE